MGERGLYLVTQQDDAEKSRLNFQSNLVEKIRLNQIFEPTIAIPKTSIRRVADIATGTGIWLENVEAELIEAGNSDFELVGFDISDAQFPKNPKKNTRFLVSDISKVFAEEWHGTFDIVHVRFLVVALTADQREKALHNVLQILKPGGFLQWTDLDFHGDEPRVYPTISPTLTVAKEGAMILAFWASQGWEKDFIGSIAVILKTCAVEDIDIKHYLDNCFSNPELQPALVEWHRLTMLLVLKAKGIRMGTSGEETEEAEAYERKIEEMGKMGTVFPIPVTTLTARKS